MAQTILTATLDDDDRPTLPARGRFDEETEHFFSNVETLPEIVPDAAFYARLAEATDPSAEEEAARWLAEQRRSVHVRLVTVLLAASVALLFAGALR
ncbi:MAG TPA: hypothetical protein VLT33_43645 [Labilithrix sp.]|nr:hypothetical protein [Labilithrix sp.]